MVLKSVVASQLVYILGPLQTDYERSTSLMQSSINFFGT